MEKEKFLNKFRRILKSTWVLFKKKNEQYGSDDPLQNFATGAELRYGDSGPINEFETLKDYMGKHIAHIYNNPLDGNLVRASLMDIAVYSIIGMIMYDEMKELEAVPVNENAVDVVEDDDCWQEVIVGDNCKIVLTHNANKVRDLLNSLGDEEGDGDTDEEDETNETT